MYRINNENKTMYIVSLRLMDGIWTFYKEIEFWGEGMAKKLQILNEKMKMKVYIYTVSSQNNYNESL